MPLLSSMIQVIHMAKVVDLTCPRCKCSQYMYGVDYAYITRNWGYENIQWRLSPFCMPCWLWHRGEEIGDGFYATLIFTAYNELQRSPYRNVVNMYIDTEEDMIFG